MSYKSIHSGPSIDKAISIVNNDLWVQYRKRKLYNMWC